MTPYCILRLVFISCVSFLFVWKFALPSVGKYAEAGVFVDKSRERRSPSDFPSFTFCALNQGSAKGWKNEKVKGNIWSSTIKKYCGHSSNMSEAMDCIHNGTFSIGETVKHSNVKRLSGMVMQLIRPNNSHWIEDITDASQGRLFSVFIPVITMHTCTLGQCFNFHLSRKMSYSSKWLWTGC